MTTYSIFRFFFFNKVVLQHVPRVPFVLWLDMFLNPRAVSIAYW